MRRVYVSGCFDDIRTGTVSFLEQAAAYGPVTLYLRDDASAASLLGVAPRFPLQERLYFVEALRWVDRVRVIGADCPVDRLPEAERGSIWSMLDKDAEGLLGSPAAERASQAKLDWCGRAELEPVVLGQNKLERWSRLSACAACATGAEPGADLPAGKDYSAADASAAARAPGNRRVAIVTGSFDWLHTGHIRFFEEAAAFGDLNVVVGHDANIRLLKGEGHPLVGQAERRYMVGSIRHVSRALVSTGSGWLDAEPEIESLKPDVYIVNADGDRDEKRLFCQRRGIEYLVLAREPRQGLPRRSSTDLRGF